MRIFNALSKAFEDIRNPYGIVPAEANLGYQKRLNPDGTIGGYVHSSAITHPNAIVQPNSIVGAFVHVKSGTVLSGTELIVKNNEVVKKSLDFLNFPPP